MILYSKKLTQISKQNNYCHRIIYYLTLTTLTTLEEENFDKIIKKNELK